MRGSARQKKTSKFFKKCPKTAFLTVFSKTFLRRRKFSQNRGKTVFRESSKNQFGRPKKKKCRQNFPIFFLNPPPPPPRENTRSAPGRIQSFEHLLHLSKVFFRWKILKGNATFETRIRSRFLRPFHVHISADENHLNSKSANIIKYIHKGINVYECTSIGNRDLYAYLKNQQDL